MRTIYSIVGVAVSGAAAYQADPNDAAVNTPPQPGDADYAERCQRWGLTDGCDYMIGDAAGTQINRAKKWQVIAGGPLNSRLYAGDDTHREEHIKVTLSCSSTNQVVDAPGKAANYYFNGMTESDIMFKYDESGRMDPEEPQWPYQNTCTGNLLKPLYDTYGADGAVTAESNPQYDASFRLSNPSARIPAPTGDRCQHHGAYAHNSEATFTDAEPHWVSCDANERLLIKVYDMTTTVEGTLIDSGYLYESQVGCLETNDEIKYYTNYGQQPGSVGGNDKCFNNRNPKYIQDPADANFNRDLPWHPYDNCYRARETGTLTPFSFADCERSSMQFFLKVEDDAALNQAQQPPLPSPMRQEHLYIKASMSEVYQSLEILPTDIMRVDFYIEKGGVSKPQSFSLSPKEYSAQCQQFASADAIACTNFNVYCTAPTDNIVLRVTGGGEHLYEKTPCAQLPEGLDGVAAGGGADKWAELAAAAALLGDNEQLEGAGEDLVHDALLVPVGITGQFTPNARVAWHYDTYTKSNVPRCYTGDAFPFEVPQCSLRKAGAAVESRAHGLADLYLHNDVLNQAISGHPTHEAMGATEVAGPLDSDYWGAQYNLQPSRSPRNLDTWYDFDAFQEETGYTGLITIAQIPICGSLQVVTPIPQQDADGNYILDDASLEIANVVANRQYDTETQAFIFDDADCPADTPAEEINYQFEFETEIQGASSYIYQTVGAYGLFLNLCTLTALLAYIY